ncbi:hypothetical protein D3C80_1277220 [compost metagenome]
MWRKTFSKTTINYFGSVINGISYGKCNVFVVFISIWNRSHSHDFYIVGNTVPSYVIVSCLSNNSGNVRSVQRFFFIRSKDNIVSVFSVFYIIRIVAHYFSAVKFLIQVIIQLTIDLFTISFYLFIETRPNIRYDLSHNHFVSAQLGISSNYSI